MLGVGEWVAGLGGGPEPLRVLGKPEKQGALRMAVLFARAALFSRRSCGALVDV